MKKLNKAQILLLHKQLIDEFGGDESLRDENLLDMSINSPYQTFNEEDLYKTIIEKAVHLGFSIIKNHPFNDGNKRVGAHAMIVLLALNSYYLEYSQNELVNIIYGVASSEKTEEDLLE